MKRPKLLLLDEPLAALDRKLREHTQFELINIQKRLGVTFIVVTHDQEEAMTLSSRMGVMNHGKIAQVGTPAAIYESPATKFRRGLHRLGQHVRRPGRGCRGPAASNRMSSAARSSSIVNSTAPVARPSGLPSGRRKST